MLKILFLVFLIFSLNYISAQGQTPLRALIQCLEEIHYKQAADLHLANENYKLVSKDGITIPTKLLASKNPSGKKVVIAAVVEMENGDIVFNTGAQIGAGHANLINGIFRNERYSGRKHKVSKILFLGEFLLKGEGERLVVSKATNTAGLANPAKIKQFVKDKDIFKESFNLAEDFDNSVESLDHLLDGPLKFFKDRHYASRNYKEGVQKIHLDKDVLAKEFSRIRHGPSDTYKMLKWVLQYNKEKEKIKAIYNAGAKAKATLRSITALEKYTGQVHTIPKETINKIRALAKNAITFDKNGKKVLPEQLVSFDRKEMMEIVSDVENYFKSIIPEPHTIMLEIIK